MTEWINYHGLNRHLFVPPTQGARPMTMAPRDTIEYLEDICRLREAHIKELEARVAELEAALKPLAALAEKIGTKPKDESCWCGQDGAVIRFVDIRRARALLKDPDQ